MEGKGSRYAHSPDSGLPSSRRGSLLSFGRRMSIWEAGDQLEADMQVFCEEYLWRIKRDSMENKWALGCTEGLTPGGEPQHSAACSNGVGEEVHAEQEQSSSGTSPTSARSVTRSNKSLSWTLGLTQRCGVWRQLANSTCCSRQSWGETWALSVNGFHVGRA